MPFVWYRSHSVFPGLYGEIPGSTEKECGNYQEHDLSGAVAIAKDMCQVLENWTEDSCSTDSAAGQENISI